MAERVLAADVGGTKTHLALFAIGGRQSGGAAPQAQPLHQPVGQGHRDVQR